MNNAVKHLIERAAKPQLIIWAQEVEALEGLPPTDFSTMSVEDIAAGLLLYPNVTGE